MKKVLEFLEKHVQWLAIGLGALFLGWMAWTYIIGTPVSVTVNNQKLGWGDIDSYIAEHPISTLKSQMDKGARVHLDAPKWLADFKCDMEFCRTKAVEMVRWWVNSSTALPKIEGGRPIEMIKPVEKLPEVPVALMGGSKVGSSTINDPAAPQNPNDRTWAAIAFQIPNHKQAADFAAVKLPSAAYQIAVLEVTLYRQQQDSSGAWGSETVVRKIPTETLMPMPAAGAPRTQQVPFYAWARTHQREILQPNFYEWVKGDQFQKPIMTAPPPPAPVAEVTEGLPNFDPNRWQYTGEEWKKMTPEQYKQAQAALKKHQEEEREKNKGKGKGSGGSKGGNVGHGGGPRAADDPDRPADVPPDVVPNPFAPEAVAMLMQQPPPGTPPAGGGRDSHSPATPPQQQPPQDQQPTNPNPPAADNKPAAQGEEAAPATQPTSTWPCPSGEYTPDGNPDWVGWAIDDTVEPGKVYRYRVVYSIKNPLWDRPQNSADKKFADILSLSSDHEKTEWSAPVKVASRTSFYIARQFHDDTFGTVPFEVFANVGGVKKSHVFEVAPGDMIGEPLDGVDFVTGSTLVEIVKDPRNDRQVVYAVVADQNGNLTRRDFKTDAGSGDYNTDKRAAASGSAASASPAPGAGAPPVASGR